MNGVQTYRNPKLVHILDKLNLIENYSTGIPRTIVAYQGSNKKPIFSATENFFTVKLPNMNFEIDQINDNISDFGLEVLKLIKEFPGIKVSDIVKKLQKNNLVANADKVRNEIKRNLVKYIEYKGSNKTGGYYLR